MRSLPLLAGSLILLLAASAEAQSFAAAPRPAGASDIVVSDQILGAPVQAETGETLGSVEDVVLDGASGRLLAVALKPSATLRADGQLTAVPVESLLPATASDGSAPQRVLRVRREAAARLGDAPAFARERWNDALTPDWMARLREHYAVKAGDAPAPERLSTLVGTDVVDSDEAAVGRVNALAVDLGRHEVAAAIVTPADGLGQRNRLLPVPFSALRPAQARAEAARTNAAAAKERRLSVDMRLEQLTQAPRFDRGDVPRLRSLLGAGEMRSFYAERPAAREPAQRGTPGATPRGASPPQRPSGRSGGDRPSTPRSDSGGARGGGSPRAR